MKQAATYRGQPSMDAFQEYRPESPSYEPGEIYRSKDYPHVFLGSAEWGDMERAARMAGIHPEDFLRFDVAAHETPGGLPDPYYSAELREQDMGEGDYRQAQGRFNAAADALVQTIQSSNRPIYVHCVAGANRSASVLAAALARLTGRGIRDVLKEMKQARMEIAPHDTYFLMAAEYSQHEDDQWLTEMQRRLDRETTTKNDRETTTKNDREKNKLDVLRKNNPVALERKWAYTFTGEKR